jgi:hypothetical protein
MPSLVHRWRDRKVKHDLSVEGKASDIRQSVPLFEVQISTLQTLIVVKLDTTNMAL